MPSRLEMARDGAEGRKKTLCLTCRFEFPHFLLSQSCGLVRVLSSIVQSFVLAMLHTRENLPFRRSITLQLISDDHAWHILQPFEQFPKESFGCFFVASALYEDIQHVAVLIHRSPQVMLLTSNRENHLIHIPLVATTRAATAQFIGRGLTKCEAPLSHRFISDDDTALGQNFLNITETEREAEIQPHSVTDNLGWETKPFVVGGSGVCFHEAILAHCSVMLPS